MIAVDTSVWVDAFRGGPTAKELSRLLDDDQVALPVPVRLELFSGARKQELGRLRHVLTALPAWPASDDAWSTAESWTESAVRAGERFGVLDLVIGAIAAGRRAPVWSLDADFERMAALRFVKLHRPRRA